MNRKGQVGPIGAIFLYLVFLVIWFVWLGGWVGQVGELVVIENNLVGIEAFFFGNLNFVIFICMLLGMLGFMYFTGE